jgi:hypothetical protein
MTVRALAVTAAPVPTEVDCEGRYARGILCA